MELSHPPRLVHLAPRALIVLLLLAGGSARAADKAWGIGAGLASALAPSDGLGGAISFSAAIGSSATTSLLGVRGELLGIATTSSQAAMPTLVGDLGFRTGRLELFLTGGVQLFGLAHRDGFTVFATLGLVGGAGLGVQLAPGVRASVRGLVAWLPTETTAKLDEPTDGRSKPNFLYLATMISLEFGFGRAPSAGELDF
jgi:hypothetical protein